MSLEDAETGELIEVDAGNAAVRRRFYELATERVRRLVSDCRSDESIPWS